MLIKTSLIHHSELELAVVLKIQIPAKLPTLSDYKKAEMQLQRAKQKQRADVWRIQKEELDRKIRRANKAHLLTAPFENWSYAKYMYAYGESIKEMKVVDAAKNE